MNEKTRKIQEKVTAAIKSSRGQNVLLYLLFVAVAFVFWVFLSLDTEVQRDFDVPVELQDVPDSVTVIGQVPQSLDVSVKGKDSQLIRFLWGKLSPVKLKWQDNVEGQALVLTHQKLDSRMREYFGNGVQIVSCRPDSLRIPFTTQPGVKVKLMVQADIHPNLQYIISGPITANVDSVTLYSVTDLPHNLKYVSTEPIVKSNLKDTMRYEIRVKPIAGVRIIPETVTVTVPIEPLIMRKRFVGIEVENLPDETNLITFPSKVEISYLVPMSAYNDDYPVKAYVDFRAAQPSRKKLAVSLSSMPVIYHNISFTPDSVEYIIENEK
ncbi:MAG: hypothetical protein HDR85_00330 [Bacteroides sp.]|nr:hypothetical protein [Bacteroides sp.]MBD5353353.1 hypothetical protein [Bacteroides sp.]MDE5826627.1 hypothetical protein [Duncaniella sp.]MDE6430441.1 hypothetical protein [Duncaniella sp.]MDE6824006.1 hypothetical protein [Duncaniella sp.]